MHKSVKKKKNMRVMVFIYTRAQIVEYSFNITHLVLRSRVAFQVRERECEGLPFRRVGQCPFFLHHLFDEKLELFPPFQPLQSCHCQLELCGCLEALLPCRRTRSRCQPSAFCKSGCWVLAMVPGPPAVVCFM